MEDQKSEWHIEKGHNQVTMVEERWPNMHMEDQCLRTMVQFIRVGERRDVEREPFANES